MRNWLLIDRFGQRGAGCGKLVTRVGPDATERGEIARGPTVAIEQGGHAAVSKRLHPCAWRELANIVQRDGGEKAFAGRVGVSAGCGYRRRLPFFGVMP